MVTATQVETLESPLQDESTKTSFPVVGIGASAGGLAAFEAFFSGMPAEGDPGMAFVLVQHLAPGHKSILSDLVKRYTRMQVFEVTDGMVVQPNCTYIIPPNHDMAFLNGSLQLLEHAVSRGLRMTIDFFFRSLAQDQHEKAICIVLSGTGSDGSLGVRAVKGEGGMVMAQNPESTDFQTDIGRPVGHIVSNLVGDDLLAVKVDHGGGTNMDLAHRAGQVAQGDGVADPHWPFKEDNQPRNKVGEDLLQTETQSHTQRRRCQ